ncbi:MAG: hypothetical protein ACP6IP_02015 [Candidatus Njordarchaeia archaeon]
MDEIDEISDLIDNFNLMEDFALSFISEIKSALMQLKVYPPSSIEFKLILNSLIDGLKSISLLTEGMLNEDSLILEEDSNSRLFNRLSELIDYSLNMIEKAEREMGKKNGLIRALSILLSLERTITNNFPNEPISDAE